MGPRNPNFDPSIRTGWDQCHCGDYQIINSTTIHGSKSELERSRYHENWDNAPIDAPLTSGSHNFWSNRWIFKFYTFLETGSQDLFRSVKINPIKDRLKVASLEGPPPWKSCYGYKRPQSPFKQNKRRSLPGFCSLPECLLHIFPLFQTHTHTKKKKKHQSLLILLSLPKTQGIVLIPNLLLFGSTSWIWGLGVWM